MVLWKPYFHTKYGFQFYDCIEFNDKLIPKPKLEHKLESLSTNLSSWNTEHDSDDKRA